MEPQTQRLCPRPQEEGSYPSLHHADTAPPKAPSLHSHGPPADLVGSPPPPPLSPRPCDHIDGELTPSGAKNSSTPIHQAFYPPSMEPCLMPQKGSTEEPQPDSAAYPSNYNETFEPTVFIGSAINPREDSTHNPWKYFNLPRKKTSNFLTPQLPVDKIRDDSSGGSETVVSVTE